jgi:hypothetical protein
MVKSQNTDKAKHLKGGKTDSLRKTGVQNQNMFLLAAFCCVY